jgi:broad specificity phosphatase PhoE
VKRRFVLPSAEAQARVSSAIRSIAELTHGRSVVIASHGNALALFLHALDAQVGFAFWAGMSMPDVFAVDVDTKPVWAYKGLWMAQ